MVTQQQKDNTPNEWHLQAPRERAGINAVGLARYARQDIRVAILDTGIDLTHPALQNGIDFDRARDFDSTTDPKGLPFYEGRLHNPYDAHGTALAGIIAAEPNGTDVVGIAPGCRIVPIRISSNFDTESLTNAIGYAADQADVVLIARTLPEDVRGAVEEAAKRKPVVCASGNSGRAELAHPASAAGTIAVGACNEHGYRSTYSQYGPNLDLVAPSNDVPTQTRNLIRQSEEEVGRRARVQATERVRRRRVQERRSEVEALVIDARYEAAGHKSESSSLDRAFGLAEPQQDYDFLGRAADLLRQKAEQIEPPVIAALIKSNAKRLVSDASSDRLIDQIARQWAEPTDQEVQEEANEIRQRLTDELHLDRLGTLAIATTDNQGPSGYNVSPDGNYCFAEGNYTFGGTSAAAAQVAAVVALMLSRAATALTGGDPRIELDEKQRLELHAALKPDTILRILKENVSQLRLRPERDLEEKRELDHEFGAGLIDATAAVEAVA